MDEKKKGTDQEINYKIIIVLILIWLVLIVSFKFYYRPTSDEAFVIITSFDIRPNEVFIKKGEKVTWQNFDKSNLTVISGYFDGHTFKPDTNFTSGLLKQGELFSVTFDEVGNYTLLS